MTPLLLVALLIAAPIPPMPPKVETKLEGVWKATERERSGLQSPLPAGALGETYTLVVVGDQYVFQAHGGTIKVDAEKKTLDLTITDGRNANRTIPGIFERTGDTLKIAIPTVISSTDRPTELKTAVGTRYYVYTLERDTKITPEQTSTKLKERREALTALGARGSRASGVPAPAPGAGPAGVGPAPVAPSAPANDQATQELLKKVLDKLDRIEKRLDEMDKKKP